MKLGTGLRSPAYPFLAPFGMGDTKHELESGLEEVRGSLTQGQGGPCGAQCESKGPRGCLEAATAVRLFGSGQGQRVLGRTLGTEASKVSRGRFHGNHSCKWSRRGVGRRVQ